MSIKTRHTIGLFVILAVALISTSLRADEYGQTKATRASQKQKQFLSGGTDVSECAGHVERGPTTEEELFLWGLGAVASVVPGGGFITGAIAYEEGGRLLAKWDVEHNQWRCFDEACLKQLVGVDFGVTTLSEFVEMITFRNQHYDDWLEQNTEVQCNNIERNMPKSLHSCSHDDCMYPIQSLPTIP